MKLVQVENRQIIKWQLPKVGQLKDGRTVSGYHLLDEETLSNEGWLPLEDIHPEYDEETQCIINDGYEVLVDKVIKKYIVEDIPIIEDLPQGPSIEDYLLDMDFRISSIELGL